MNINFNDGGGGGASLIDVGNDTVYQLVLQDSFQGDQVC